MKCLERLQPSSLKLFFFFSFFLFFLSFNSYGAILFLKNRAVVERNAVFLNDVAKIEGTSVEKQVLSSLSLGKSPPLCKSKFFTVKEIKHKVNRFEEENGIKLEILYKGSPIVEVVRACSLLPKEKVLDKLKSLIEKNYKDYLFLSAFIPKVVLPCSNCTFQITISSLGNYYGRATCNVFSKEGKLVKSISIPFRVEKKVTVVVAKRNIPKGKVITLEDVTLKGIPINKGREGLVSLKEALGKVTKKDFRKGEVLKRRYLQPKFIVFRGKPVKVIYSEGNIHIELLGIPLENGAFGDIISVKNISTGKKLICRVIGKNTVLFLSR